MKPKPSGSPDIFYHIGKQPPIPQPPRWEKGWNRPHHPYANKDGFITDRVVFLSPNPQLIGIYHGFLFVKGSDQVYLYHVPKSVQRKVGGVNWFDGAPELIIPQDLWHQVEFLGKAKYNELKDWFPHSTLDLPSKPQKGPKPEIDREKADKILKERTQLNRQRKKYWERERRKKSNLFYQIPKRI